MSERTWLSLDPSESPTITKVGTTVTPVSQEPQASYQVRSLLGVLRFWGP